MSVTKLQLWPLFFLLLFLEGSHAQSPFNIKWEPKLSFTQEISNRWKVNLAVGGLADLGGLGEDANPPGLDRLDISGFGTYELFNGNSLTLGYMFRKDAPLDLEGYEHRITSQFSFYSYWQAYRLSNRIRAEQRLRESGYTLRLRYRLSLDFPLNGEKIDPGEGYLIFSEEPLLSLNRQGGQWENRLGAGGGWQINGDQKLELGLEFRYRGSERPMALHVATTFYRLL